MKLKATFYNVSWLDSNGHIHRSKFLGNKNEIKKAAKLAGAIIQKMTRITDRNTVRELSLETLANG